MKFEPFVVLYEPKQVNKLEVKVEGRIIPMCKDCIYAASDMVCTHPNEWGNEVSRNNCDPNWFCADGKGKESE